MAELNRKLTLGINCAWKDPGLFPPPGNHSTLSQVASPRCRYFLMTQKPFCKHRPHCPQKQIWSSLHFVLPYSTDTWLTHAQEKRDSTYKNPRHQVTPCLGTSLIQGHTQTLRSTPQKHFSSFMQRCYKSQSFPKNSQFPNTMLL